MSDTKSQRKKGADRAQEPALRCPRCDSPNTKFCYYNNYSLSQPRHFCKTCRRYWTKGGALRNVPIGGGCQKGKKAKSSSSRLAMDSTISDVGGLRFFQVISPSAMDFQLNFPRLGTPNPGLCCQFPSPNPAIPTNPCFSFDPTTEGTSSSIGLGFPLSSSAFKPLEGTNTTGFQEMGSYNRNFESELHWKLQQQRLSMLVFGDHYPNIATPSAEPTTSIQKQQPLFFHNLEISNLKQQATAPTRKDDTTTNTNPSTEWLLEHHYATQLTTPTLATNPTTANEATNWSTNEGSFGLISGI